MLTEKSCGAILLKKVNEKIYTLVIQQKDGHWGFPKGHVEGNETEEETAFREVKEETGLEVELLPDFREVLNYNPKPDIYKTVVYFMARPVGGNESCQEAELKDMLWIPLIDAISLLTFDNDAILLRKAIRFMKQSGMLESAE